MGKIVATAAALLLTASGTVWAQAAKPGNAEAQAAMERAQRLAANPMKVILQASKFKRKGAEPDTAPEAVEPASVRRTAVRTGPAAESTGTPAAKSAPVVQAAAPAPAPAPVAVPAPPPQEAPAPKLMPASLLAGAAPGPVPALDEAVPEAALPAMPKVVAPQALPVAAAAQRPTLVAMVEPEIPVRMLGDSGRVNEVFADLSLRADGTVAGVAVLPPVPRSWRPYIMAALEKWRFEPLSDARVHRVQLVFDEK